MRHFFVAGFDFGTSYSKVVVRDQLTGVAKAVTFGDSRSGLFPSFVRVRPGIITGPDGSGDGLLLSYPKLIATDAASGRSNFSSLYGDSRGQLYQLLETQSLQGVALIVLARFFLSVLNAVHAFIQNDEDWHRFDPSIDPLVVQVAVPIGLNAEDNACDKMMQRALAAATLLKANAKSLQLESSVSELKRAFRELDDLQPAIRENLDARCITYPEVAAGVQTVLRSPNTPDGKYITMDVGAGTVDLNAFLRRRRTEHDTGAGLDYWACEVRPLGFARLKLPHTHQAKHERSVNPLAEGELLGELQVALAELMRGAFRYQPNRVSGGGPSPWSMHTFAYIWGGGAAHPAYEETLLKGLKSLRIGVHGANRLELPTDQFVKPYDVDFGRLAVAYGLSFHKANLESVRLPSQLKQFDELHPAYWHEIINAENVCSCRGNPACLRCFGSGLIRPDASIVPTFIVGVPQPAHPIVVHKSRVQIMLEKCVDKYHRLHPRNTFLIERFLLLSQIHHLRHRSEIGEQSMICEQARNILIENVRIFSGRVRVLKHSAKPSEDGCQCVVVRPTRDSHADVRIHGPTQQIEKVVNHDDDWRFTDLVCRIHRTDRREFILKFEDVAPDPKPHRPHAKSKDCHLKDHRDAQARRR